MKTVAEIKLESNFLKPFPTLAHSWPSCFIIAGAFIAGYIFFTYKDIEDNA